MLTIAFAQFPIFLTISNFFNAFAPAPISSVYFILVLSGYEILAITGTWIGPVKVIFTLPTTLDISVDPRPAPPQWPLWNAIHHLLTLFIHAME